MTVDLHLHTNVSDGKLTPKELIQEAARLGMSVIAITDHDATEGIAPALEALRDFPSLTLLPGVEISTDIPRGEIHILGYFIDYENEGLKSTLASLRESRRERAQRMLAKLKGLGIHIDWERVMELAGEGSVGRPHIALAMFEKGYVSNPQEAFIKYIGRNGPAYAEREKLTPMEAVEWVVKVGGLPVLAHPAEIENLESVLTQLKQVGLVGMEAYYGGYSEETVHRLVKLASRYGLIPCGGSDYHGLGNGAGTDLGSVTVPLESAQRLIDLAKQRSTDPVTQ